MPSPRRPLVSVAIAIGLVIALVASACSSAPVSDRAASGGAAGDPTTLPALPGTEAVGERVPVWTGAVLTPQSWVSTSLTPTLTVPGATGAWTFTLTDLSDGTSSFGTKTYAEAGATSRVPLGAGLEQGNVYAWTASSPGQAPVGGSFTVDTQMPGVQQADALGGVNVGLSSGEASFAWSSHTMGAVPGSVGFGLQFQASNADEVGVPTGWSLQAASSFPYNRLMLWSERSVGLVGTDGQVSNYRLGAGDAWVPAQLGGGELDTSGLAPVLLRNPDGTFAVTTKSATAVFAADGDTGVAYLSSVEGKDSPMLGQSWTSGRLQSVTDPVSNRSIEFVYGGGDCPKPATGFIAAPEGMLCRVKFWDGSTSAILYVDTAVGPSIGRLVDYPEAKGQGAQVVDLAYDGAGRIARTRSPLVAAAAASNVIDAGDEQFWTSVTYTPTGRVASITGIAPSPGATRCTRTYDNEGSFTQVTDSCFGAPVYSVEFDATTFFPLRMVNGSGLTASNQWNLASGELLASTDWSGLTTAHRYENGAVVQTWGPTKGSIADAMTTTKKYDEAFVGSEPVAMKGLDVTYWPGAAATPDGAVQELGPRRDGALTSSLTVNWPASPAGNDGEWTGLMTGSLQVATAGDYRIVSGNATAKVRVNNVLCVDGACDALPLRAGANQIRIDLSSDSPAASMDISWSGPDTGGVARSIPTDALRPGYGYVTTTTAEDPSAVRAPTTNVSKSIYAEPATGRVAARLNQTGSRMTFAYSGARAGSVEWTRPSAVTADNGATYRTTYWGNTESAKSPCPGASAANQGGSAKESIAPGPDGGDGPTTTQWVDASGAIVASRLPGGVLVCTTLGKAGQVLSVEVVGNGRTQKVVNDDALDGNPLVTENTETNGAEVTTTRTEVDLLGRTVRSVDRYGIVTVVTYDTRTGNVATSTVTAPGRAPVVVANTWDAKGWLAATSVDGKAVTTPTYGADGLMASIAYGNGVTVRNGYNQQNRLVSKQWATPAGAFAHTREVSAGGITSSATLSAPSGASTFTYSYDADNRLSGAAVTAGLVPVSRQWAWTFDSASNRLTQKVTDNGAVVGDHTYSYNQASQLVATTDPAASDGLTYDDRGNATKVGPDTFTYDNANNVISATDGTVTVEYARDVTGAVITKTTTGGPGAGTIRYSETGVLLDAESNAYAIELSLPGGVRLTRPLGTGTERWQFTALDGDGFFTTDGAGALLGAPQVYDPYGNVLTVPDAPAPGVPSTTWEAVTGNETEALRTTYQLMGARVYIPALGRFAQLDPKVGGSANGYDYVNQDPVNASDPSGNENENWLVNTISIVAAFAVAALVAPAKGALVGAIVGGAVGAVVTGITHAAEYFITGQTEFSAWRLGLSVLAGSVGGGLVGRVKFARAASRKNLETMEADGLVVLTRNKKGTVTGFHKVDPRPQSVSTVRTSFDVDSVTGLPLEIRGAQQVAQRASLGAENLVDSAPRLSGLSRNSSFVEPLDPRGSRELLGRSAGSYKETMQRKNFLDVIEANYD